MFKSKIFTKNCIASAFPNSFKPSASQLGLLAGAAIIGIAVFIAYFPSLRGDFVFDDDLLLTENKIVNAQDGLYKLWCTSEAPEYYPASYGTNWIEWRLWGLHPAGYHLSNLILHTAEAFLIWIVLRKLSIPGAFLAALIFAVHPVNVESVAWIAQRRNIVAMLFFLLSIFWYLKVEMPTPSARMAPANAYQLPVCRSSRWYWLSLAAFLLAMLGKGSTAILPILLLGILWWLQPEEAAPILDPAEKWLLPFIRRQLPRIAPFFAIAVALSMVDIWFQTYGMDVVYRKASIGDRLVGSGCVVWFYLYKALLPIDLCFVYPQWKIEAGNPLWWLPLLAALSVTAVLLRYKNGWGRPLLFSWGFFCVALIPVMGFKDVGFMQYSLVADHYQHIALIGIIALASAAWCLWSTRMRGALYCTAAALAIATAGLLAFLTWQQNGIYRDGYILYRTVLEKNPNCWMAHSNLSKVLFEMLQPGEAIDQCRQALELNPDCWQAHHNLSRAFLDMDQPEEAIEHCKQVLTLKPDYPDAQNNWGLALLKEGRVQEAVEHYNKALAFEPDYAEGHNNLGAALIQIGRFQEAIEHCRQAIKLNSDYAKAYNNLGVAMLDMGRPQEAIENFQQAIKLNPDYADAHNNLGNAFIQAGRFQEAMDYCRQALEIDPNSAEAHNTLGNALKSLGRYEEASKQFEESLKLDPNSSQAHINLGSVLAQMGKIPQAIEHYRQALRLKPDSIEAHNNLGNALQSIGQYQQAIEHFESALRLNPNITQVHANLAFALAHAGRFPEAIEHYRQALRLNPELTHVYLNLALIYSKNKQSSEALDIAQKGLEQARSKGETELAKDIESWLNSYRAGLRDIPKDAADAGSAAPTP